MIFIYFFIKCVGRKNNMLTTSLWPYQLCSQINHLLVLQIGLKKVLCVLYRNRIFNLICTVVCLTLCIFIRHPFIYAYDNKARIRARTIGICRLGKNIPRPVNVPCALFRAREVALRASPPHHKTKKTS